MEKKRIIICIPAYNSEKTIISVIERIPADLFDKVSEVVIFDNNSHDNTYQIVADYIKRKKVEKIKINRNKTNLFYGGNIKAAIDYSIKNNIDIMAELHSDGQYPPEKIAELIKPIEEDKAQAVSGSRFLENPLTGKMPIWRYLGNILLTQFENMLVGKRLSEWHSGFRAYDINALKNLQISKCENGYEWTTEILLMLLSNGYNIAEISIPTHYGEESKSPSAKRTFMYCIKTMKITTGYFLHKKGIINIDKYKPIKDAQIT